MDGVTVDVGVCVDVDDAVSDAVMLDEADNELEEDELDDAVADEEDVAEDVADMVDVADDVADTDDVLDGVDVLDEEAVILAVAVMDGLSICAQCWAYCAFSPTSTTEGTICTND